MENGRITCAAAHGIAGDFKIAPSEIGKDDPSAGIPHLECQLGLYGYSPERKIVKAAEVVSEDVRDHLRRFAADGDISCASCREIAQTLDIERMAVAAACERLDIKIRHCQVGAF